MIRPFIMWQASPPPQSSLIKGEEVSFHVSCPTCVNLIAPRAGVHIGRCYMAKASKGEALSSADRRAEPLRGSQARGCERPALEGPTKNGGPQARSKSVE